MTRRPWIRRWWLLLACPLVAIVAAAIYSQTLTPTYEVESEIALDISKSQERRQRDKPVDQQLTDKSLARSWAGIPSSRSFLEVIGRREGAVLSTDQMHEQVRSYNVAGSNRISMTLRDSDRGRAVLAGRQITDAMMQTIRQWPDRPATALVVKAPSKPLLPIDPDVPRALLLAVVMGLTIGFIATFARTREQK